MMWETALRYGGLVRRTEVPEARFEGGYADWPALEKLADRWSVRIGFGALYSLFYFAFATHWWQFLLLPVHFVMGPMHGAIVNWCGHRYGYRNFESDDVSRNTLVFDVLTAGELFQNNHHKFGMSPNFAARWFEIDPTYQVMKVLAWLKIIDMSKAQTMRWSKKLAAGRTVSDVAVVSNGAPVGGE
jgi:stearoyl-CoA desaturase (delta-9 desaturase)